MREILFRGKRLDNGEWVEGNLVLSEDTDEEFEAIIIPIKNSDMFTSTDDKDLGFENWYKVDKETICQYTGLTDKNGKRIWENDILMCHGNPDDLVKAVFGELGVRDAETGTVVDKVIGWHYEVIPTDVISRIEPFCYSMPLTKEYIELCEMEVVDNPELLQEASE